MDILFWQDLNKPKVPPMLAGLSVRIL